eukprot:Seg1629.2 transcript_id=Seg1629.2/GoldUCD/mRNA.D3Y31 product="hypothetical protein" protein_id=Seg1629.2/GoldUCD/D3Y31
MKFFVIHCGTNNLDRDTSLDIADGIKSIVSVVQRAKPNAKIIVTGLLPRDLRPSYRRQKIQCVNENLRNWCQNPAQQNIYYLKPEKEWLLHDGTLNTHLFYKDHLHLVEPGNNKFAKSIYNMITELKEGYNTNCTPSNNKDSEKYQINNEHNSLKPHTHLQNQSHTEVAPTHTATKTSPHTTTSTKPPPYSVTINKPQKPAPIKTPLHLITPPKPSPPKNIPPKPHPQKITPTKSHPPKTTPAETSPPKPKNVHPKPHPPKIIPTKPSPPKTTPAETSPPKPKNVHPKPHPPKIIPTKPSPPKTTPAETSPPKITSTKPSPPKTTSTKTYPLKVTPPKPHPPKTTSTKPSPPKTTSTKTSQPKAPPILHKFSLVLVNCNQRNQVHLDQVALPEESPFTEHSASKN